MLSLTSGTVTGDSDIPDTIEDGDGTGTIHIIRSSESTDFHNPYLLYKPHTTSQTETAVRLSRRSTRCLVTRGSHSNCDI